MLTLYLAVAALIAFVAGVGILGLWVRRSPARSTGEQASRIAHFLFFTCLGVPVLVALFTPGLTRLDALAGLDPLPYRTACLVLGVALAIPGLYFFSGSNKYFEERLLALRFGPSYEEYKRDVPFLIPALPPGRS